MSTIVSLLTIVAILVVMSAPQALAVYFSEWRNAEHEEYEPAGR